MMRAAALAISAFALALTGAAPAHHVHKPRFTLHRWDYLHRGETARQDWRSYWREVRHRHAPPFPGVASYGTPTIASYEGLVGSGTACGRPVNTYSLGTASLYPCGTKIRIQYGSHVVVAITMDHGPYVYGRSLDLWDATVRALGFRSGADFGVRHVLMTVGG